MGEKINSLKEIRLELKHNCLNDLPTHISTVTKVEGNIDKFSITEDG